MRAELAAARERYESARIRLSAFDAALLRGAREEREAALASFRTGDLSLIELLDFERALARAETSACGMLDAADALADLLAGGTGGPDHEDASPGVEETMTDKSRTMIGARQRSSRCSARCWRFPPAAVTARRTQPRRRKPATRMSMPKARRSTRTRRSSRFPRPPTRRRSRSSPWPRNHGAGGAGFTPGDDVEIAGVVFELDPGAPL